MSDYRDRYEHRCDEVPMPEWTSHEETNFETGRICVHGRVRFYVSAEAVKSDGAVRVCMVIDAGALAWSRSATSSRSDARVHRASCRLPANWCSFTARSQRTQKGRTRMQNSEPGPPRSHARPEHSAISRSVRHSK